MGNVRTATVALLIAVGGSTGCATLTVRPIKSPEPVCALVPNCAPRQFQRVALFVQVDQERSEATTLVPVLNRNMSNYVYYDDADGLIFSRFEAALLKRGAQIVERENLARVLKEHDLSAAGITDSGGAQLISRVTGADALLLVRVPAIRGRLVYVHNIYGAVCTYLNEISLSTKLIDATNAEVLWTCSAGRTSESLLNAPVSINNLEVMRSPLIDKIPNAASVINAAIDDVMMEWPAPQ